VRRRSRILDCSPKIHALDYATDEQATQRDELKNRLQVYWEQQRFPTIVYGTPTVTPVGDLHD